MAAIEQNAEARVALGHLIERLQGQRLECADALSRCAGFAREIFQLRAVIAGEHGELVVLPVPRRRPMQVFELGVLAQPERPLLHGEEILHLFPGGHRRRAAMTRDHDRA